MLSPLPPLLPPPPLPNTLYLSPPITCLRRLSSQSPSRPEGEKANRKTATSDPTKRKQMKYSIHMQRLGDNMHSLSPFRSQEEEEKEE
ncbi:hypothetical protein E2C01_080064 [Portunus trituberculatus]|uniref:Uncharacterized protein n=1 Tax=Portunus trituberculatus TaxID=210409 RepID=A0A5B7IS57_PORTR|nr:hypothetical protein [Portunus trituberculatus]